MSYRVFLVEDDVNLNSVLTKYLQQEGWEVSSFQTGEDARGAIGSDPHLWVLDIMLPDTDGYQLIREIRRDTPDVPIVFISARDADIDRILGLEMGGDDYLPKPFLPRELVVRVSKLLDRVYGRGLAADLITVQDYVINEAARTVKVRGATIELTSREFDLIHYFVRNLGQALSREQILNQIWGSDYFGTDRVVDDLVRRLRKKTPGLRIETIYGYGYRMVRS